MNAKPFVARSAEPINKPVQVDLHYDERQQVATGNGCGLTHILTDTGGTNDVDTGND